MFSIVALQSKMEEGQRDGLANVKPAQHKIAGTLGSGFGVFRVQKFTSSELRNIGWIQKSRSADHVFKAWACSRKQANNIKQPPNLL